LQYFTADLGLPIADKNKSALLIQLNQYLIGCYRKGSTAVLIVDEGQLLGWDVLEEIRLLTNLETVQQKLLQIVLVGQPELERKLDSADLRQLKQRISPALPAGAAL
jgi:type II secretory pathway predicted ATPase ExeA